MFDVNGAGVVAAVAAVREDLEDRGGKGNVEGIDVEVVGRSASSRHRVAA